MFVCYLGLGSNIGNRLFYLQQAVDKLRDCCIELLAVSSVYETEPWGVTNQDKYLNACLKIKTDLSPEALLALCLNIEDELGRVRLERWGERTVDIDLLLIESITINTETLTIPHPMMKERRFVLECLADLESNLTLPTGEKIADLLKNPVIASQNVDKLTGVKISII